MVWVGWGGVGSDWTLTCVLFQPPPLRLVRCPLATATAQPQTTAVSTVTADPHTQHSLPLDDCFPPLTSLSPSTASLLLDHSVSSHAAPPPLRPIAAPPGTCKHPTPENRPLFPWHSRCAPLFCTAAYTQSCASSFVLVRPTSDPVRRPVALTAIESNKLTLQGPMMLKQGFVGVIPRLPIFIGNVTNPHETFGWAGQGWEGGA